MGGVVDEDIYTAQLRYGLRDDCAALTRVLDVAGKQDGLSAGFRHQPFGLSGVVVLVEIGDQNVSALSGVGDGNRPADPAIATGDDGLLALEATASLVGRFAMIGRWLHRSSLAGHRLVLVRKRGAGVVRHGLACALIDRNCT